MTYSIKYDPIINVNYDPQIKVNVSSTNVQNTNVQKVSSSGVQSTHTQTNISHVANTSIQLSQTQRPQVTIENSSPQIEYSDFETTQLQKLSEALKQQLEACNAAIIALKELEKCYEMCEINRAKSDIKRNEFLQQLEYLSKQLERDASKS